jgi:hypothetical protein
MWRQSAIRMPSIPSAACIKPQMAAKPGRMVLHTNDTSGAADLVMDPSNPNKLLA